MKIDIPLDCNAKMDFVTLQKMVFVFNAIQDGWTVKKDTDKYVFTKSHNNTKEVYLDSYLKQFLSDNFDIGKLAKGCK